MIKIVGYPEGNIMDISEKLFNILKHYNLVQWGDEPPVQWRFNNGVDEDVIELYIKNENDIIIESFDQFKDWEDVDEIIKSFNKWLDINEDFVYHKKLCNILWNDDMEINQRLRKKFIKIAREFYEKMKFDAEILDVHLTGSMCQYNYTKYSDFDIHIIIDFAEINEDKKLVKELADAKRSIWNTKHNITIKGHDVELYTQDVEAPHYSSGLYSLLDDKWIKKPVYNKPYVDDDYINLKYNALLIDIELLESESDKEHTPDECEQYYQMTDDLIKKISKSRKEGLAIGGEFSVENLVFKKIRNEGKFKDLFTLANKFYDKIYIQ